MKWTEQRRMLLILYKQGRYKDKLKYEMSTDDKPCLDYVGWAASRNNVKESKKNNVLNCSFTEGLFSKSCLFILFVRLCKFNETVL